MVLGLFPSQSMSSSCEALSTTSGLCLAAVWEAAFPWAATEVPEHTAGRQQWNHSSAGPGAQGAALLHPHTALSHQGQRFNPPMVHTRSEKDRPGAGQSWEVAAATAVPMGPAASQPRPAPTACRMSAVPGGTPRGSWATSQGPSLLTHNKQMCHNSLKPLFVKSIKIAQLRYSSSWPAWFLEGSSCVLALSISETWDLQLICIRPSASLPSLHPGLGCL